MSSRKILLAFATTSLLCAGAVRASDIYRYTDDDGNVSYVDRPSAQPGGERIDITSRSTNTATVQNQVQATTAYAETTAARRLAKTESARVAADEAATRKERNDSCQLARRRLDSLIASRRLYRQGDDGERIYLDEAEIKETRSKAQAQIEESCD